METLMTIHDLIDKLRVRKADDEYWNQQKREWLSALDRLFDDIEMWLAPAREAGVLTTSRANTVISEQELGAYGAPTLRIGTGRLTVHLEPVGALVTDIVVSGGMRHIGLRGRVDLICGPLKVPLARTSSGNWKALPLRGEPLELNEKSFVEILSEVLLDG
jgi:hypothetical protein